MLFTALFLGIASCLLCGFAVLYYASSVNLHCPNISYTKKEMQFIALFLSIAVWPALWFFFIAISFFLLFFV